MVGLMKLQNKRNNYSISHVALIDKYPLYYSSLRDGSFCEKEDIWMRISFSISFSF